MLQNFEGKSEATTKRGAERQTEETKGTLTHGGRRSRSKSIRDGQLQALGVLQVPCL